MMEAAYRARGINGAKRPIVETQHGKDYEFVMALHINDLVSIQKDKTNKIYRIQKIDQQGKHLKLRLHTAAEINNPTETLLDRESTIPALMQYELKPLKINAIGKSLDD